MRHEPQRSCVGCRAVRGKRELVRVVRTPDGRFALDPLGKLPGRGAYVCPSSGCLAQAIKRKGFDRALRQSLTAEAEAALDAAIREYVDARLGSGKTEAAG